MASLAHQSSVAAPAPARPAARSRPGRKLRARRRPRLLGGVVWIIALAALLGGIVAVNVAVLRLNVRLQHVDDRAAELRAANRVLEAQLSSVGSPLQVASVAQRRLGLVPAPPDETTYVDLAARSRR